MVTLLRVRLSTDECMDALTRARWARLAATRNALPTIEVATCWVEGDTMWLSPPTGGWSDGRTPAGVVAVEAGEWDDVAAPRWTVVLVAEIRPVAAGARALPAPARGPGVAVVRVSPETLEGWRFLPTTEVDERATPAPTG